VPGVISTPLRCCRSLQVRAANRLVRENPGSILKIGGSGKSKAETERNKRVAWGGPDPPDRKKSIISGRRTAAPTGGEKTVLGGSSDVDAKPIRGGKSEEASSLQH